MSRWTVTLATALVLAVPIASAWAQPADAPTPPAAPSGNPDDDTVATDTPPTDAPPTGNVDVDPAAAAPPGPVALAAPAPSTPTSASATPALRLELELFAEGRHARLDGPDLTEARLTRAEAGLTVAMTRSAHAELRLEAIRSAAPMGAIGIDGDSLVLRLKRAGAQLDHHLGPVALAVRAGLVADPWILERERGGMPRALDADVAEAELGWDSSDLGAVATLAWSRLALDLAIGNGEGRRYPERNRGQTVTVVARATVIDTVAGSAPAQVRLAATVRDGSLGPAAVRERRVGAGVGASSRWGDAGATVVRAWGLDGRGEPTGLAVGAWAELPIAAGVVVAGHGHRLTIDDDGGHRALYGAAVGYRAPTRLGALRLYLALARRNASGAAAPIAGTTAGDATSISFVLATTAIYQPE